MSRPSDRRSTSSANCRGSTEDRRRRRQFLLDKFGDGTTCPCQGCGGELDDETLTVDRIIPNTAGGRYTRDNIQPMCMPCNIAKGDNYLEGHPDWDGALPIAVEPPPRSREFEGVPPL